MADSTATMLNNPFTTTFNAMVEGLLQEFHVPGLSITVVHGKETFAKGYGYASIATGSTPSRPMTPQTLLGTASTTKAFIALVLAQIVHSEKVKDEGTAINTSLSLRRRPITWQTPVSTLLPADFVLPTPELTQAVTLEDILCHRTGLPSCDNACLSWGAGIHADTPASVTRKLRYFPTNTTLATLRTRFVYSNTMYSAAQHLIETLEDRTLSEVLRERIFNMLGMQRTFFGHRDIEAAGDDAIVDKAKGYRWKTPTDAEDEGEYIEIPWRGSPEQGGAGDIVSCVSDYALWVRAVLSQDERLLSKEGWREVLRPRVIVPDGEEDDPKLRKYFSTEMYSLGWFLESYRGEQIVQHDGRDPGIGTSVVLLPSHGYGITIFANTSQMSSTVAQIIAMHLIDNLLQVPAAGRTDFLALSREGVAKETDEKVLENFADKAKVLFSETEGDRSRQVDLGVPLRSCAGRYRHLGYGVIDVQAIKLGKVRRQRKQPATEDDEEEVLFVDMRDRTFPGELVFKHHNAAFFVVEDWDMLEKEVIGWMRAELRINVKGVVDKIGVGFAEENGIEELVWFERFEEEKSLKSFVDDEGC